MKILHSLYYYRPHYSGLTVYTERLVRELGRRGHEVTVLTSRYDPSLDSHERIDGVHVRRIGVLATISKGPVMPSLLYWVWRYGRDADVLHVHVPQLDAAPIALIGRLLGKPVILTYHCDLRLPTTFLNRIANWLSNFANQLSVALADIIVANAMDYAQASSILQGHLEKLIVIPPPIEIPEPSVGTIEIFKQTQNILPSQKIIGMAARLASEKGVEYLLEALPIIQTEMPDVRVLYVGQHLDVMGEDAYADHLRPMIDAIGDAWTFVGVLSSEEMAAFYRICDVTILPSINSTESFGMVQVESMLCGTPVVASDLPGVRQPVLQTGMGEIAPPRNSEALAAQILRVLRDPHAYQVARNEVEDLFSVDVIANRYEEIYTELLSRKQDAETI
jgi:glycosyltransferase involved in cell wall biosynthesis